ncbi:MAG TPA: hypothetical protein VI997_00590, partial [Candidatus Thermoplasmatota archaeon]|nr:hypothetical protein [Candidatus Thermoplasmatota archaeon]
MITLLAGNSRVLLTVDEHGDWSNLYYPFAGQYQHLREVRLGVFDVDAGEFTWLGKGRAADDVGRVRQGYLHDSNCMRTVHTRPGLEVTVDDVVHSNHDLIIRRLTLQNREARARHLRLMQYQSLTIAESMYQDTAYWDDERRTVNHYKRNYYFQLWGRPDFDAFTCGEHTLKGLQGSYVDAEDGRLEGGRISHGAADSVVQWNVDVPPHGEAVVHLLVMMGHSRHDVNSFYDVLAKRAPEQLTDEAIRFWGHWLP